MDLNEHKKLARELMDSHRLVKWRIQYSHSKRTFGTCFRNGRIQFSKYLVELNNVEKCRDNILHEIAHALTPGAHHGPIWEAMALKIGAIPKRCFESDVVIPEAKWLAMCDNHGLVAKRNRKLTGGVCKKCKIPVKWVINIKPL